ncbi:hypothetical protein Lal_00034878 [Lupinus albus]|uniref:Putative RNA recognition motif domain, PWI domain-containing protein n=1 Tax=Lupinus albus TaxID=3870 RepID=A0A6A4QWP4_LUPAL|nr:putative RNA recognition motif domain, PWI domain-containing protein [Lupinus albus]KAF1897175.1 hypothetical protein Lal_00034878 [Lupinus albus]
MGSVDNRTFNANFTVDGAAMLKERVNEKLKEFMGDYTDDTLVEYVIVLLRNGRNKGQAKDVLDVFLGDDSDSFVSWLWDHLALNIDLYVQPQELQDEAPKRKLISEVQVGGDGFQDLNSEGKSSKLSRSRRNRDWKGLVGRETKAPTLRSFVVDNTNLEDKTRSKVNCSPMLSSPPPFQRKRGRDDEQQKTKRDADSQVTIDAPRRLLKFAMRDAVATSRPSNLGTPVVPSFKRLRSVVSTSSGESSLVERPQRMQTLSSVVNPMTPFMKAVAEAAEDVVKSKSCGSVFDRLGCGLNPADGNSQLEDNYLHQEQSKSLYLQKTDYDDPYGEDMTLLEHESGYPFDSNSDNEGCDNMNVMTHGVTGASQFGTSAGNRGDDSLMVQYSVAKNSDDRMHLKYDRDLEQPATAPSTSKIVNISGNVNTWKSSGLPQYQNTREIAELDGHQPLDSEIGAPRSGRQLIKENVKDFKINNGNANPGFQKEPHKAQLSTTSSSFAGCHLEDADSRTIFASNVHFAATKDSLSRHFNKFGEVLKVILVTDAATGQPKGAAYVEFMQKDAADNALSLNGTSFMSRILKVVTKSAARLESAPSPAVPWPPTVRGSPFPGIPIARGSPGAFRTRPPIKFGARSMQWNRDAQGTSSGNAASSSNSSIFAPAARGFTYVRPESKLEGR